MIAILFGCSQEKYFIDQHNHGKIDFKEKSFKEALAMPVFNDAYKQVAKSKSAFRSTDDARTALEDQFGFTIVADSPVRIITQENGTILYTLLIERDVKEELIFENLMIKVYDNEISAAIFEYTLTEKGEMTSTGEYPIKGIESTLFTDLNIAGKIFFNGAGETCFDSNLFVCNVADTRPAPHIPTS